MSAQALADYLRSQARWRELKGEEFEDNRNHLAARALRSAADHVEGLPADDERIRAMEAAGWFPEMFSPGEEAGHAVRVYGFHGRPAAGPEGLLDKLAEAASPHVPDIGPENQD